MSELNPYEAPQSAGAGSERRELASGHGYPTWIGTALKAQLGSFVLAILLSQALFFFQGLLILFGLLTMLVLVSAIRYRIVWLVVLELIVIGLPLMMWYLVEFQR